MEDEMKQPVVANDPSNLIIKYNQVVYIEWLYPPAAKS